MKNQEIVKYLKYTGVGVLVLMFLAVLTKIITPLLAAFGVGSNLKDELDKQDEIDKIVVNNAATYRDRFGQVVTGSAAMLEAKKIQKLLGTDSYFSMTEDENEVYKLLQRHSKNSYELVRASYNTLELKKSSGDLNMDLINFMDEYLINIQYLLT